eukprot:3593622-Karenia_brevis.AAC.1
MQQQQFQEIASATPEKVVPKPMYAAAVLGKPISDSRVSEIIGPNYDTEAEKQKWAEEWEPRDRESGKEP